ncbi:hypothetical protein [Nocardia sp. NPDC004123]
MSRTAGNNRSRGYKTYCNGAVVGFVSALDRANSMLEHSAPGR